MGKRDRNGTEFGLGRSGFVQPACGVAPIAFGHDVVPLENVAGTMAAQFHRRGFGDATANHAAYASSAPVVENGATIAPFL